MYDLLLYAPSGVKKGNKQKKKESFFLVTEVFCIGTAIGTLEPIAVCGEQQQRRLRGGTIKSPADSAVQCYVVCTGWAALGKCPKTNRLSVDHQLLLANLAWLSNQLHYNNDNIVPSRQRRRRSFIRTQTNSKVEGSIHRCHQQLAWLTSAFYCMGAVHRHSVSIRSLLTCVLIIQLRVGWRNLHPLLGASPVRANACKQIRPFSVWK